MDYRFSDFTEYEYEKILVLAKEKYQFHHFDDIDKMNAGIIWRHDIDYSVHRAAALSAIEKKVGISATYFVMLHSEFYNTWEKEIREKLSVILNNGGEIGLHFAPDYYGFNKQNIRQMEEKIEEEKIFLERLLDTKIKAFSFHNPDTNGGFLELEQFKLAGLINVYHKSIREEYKYCSDSNGYWRFEQLQNFLKKHSSDEKLHVLTHPVWWTPSPMSPRQRIQRAIDGRRQFVGERYDSDLLKAGRLNIK